MRIFIITMDDPIHTQQFIKYIIQNRRNNIIGVAIAEGDRLTIGKKSKIVYLFSLLLIMGLPAFIKNSWITLFFKIRKKLSKLSIYKDPSLATFVRHFQIPLWEIKTPNSKKFLQDLSKLEPDIIINQSQSIIKKELIALPKIGILNRHNALLPKNRGRLTPFWVLYKQEKETGVSIHFVEEGIDSGDIVIQKSYPITPKDTFNSIVKKNYQIAPQAMMEALDYLESGKREFIKNDDNLATYNSVPDFKHAWKYRICSLKMTFTKKFF